MTRLFHFTNHRLTLTGLGEMPQLRETSFKPKGLWLSVNDAWRRWCQGEMPAWVTTRAFEITLRGDASVKRLSTRDELETFTREYPAPLYAGPGLMNTNVSWRQVAGDFDGLIIAPYVHDARMHLMWYYGWDIASGCIWNPRAIECIDEIDPAEIPTEEVVDERATNDDIVTNDTGNPTPR